VKGKKTIQRGDTIDWERASNFQPRRKRAQMLRKRRGEGKNCNGFIEREKRGENSNGGKESSHTTLGKVD